jgi:hypothetical protein
LASAEVVLRIAISQGSQGFALYGFEINAS